MRAAIIVCLLALTLGGIFYFFVMRGGPEFTAAELAPPSATTKVVPTTIPSLDPNVPVGKSAGVWVQSMDPKSLRVVNEFRSEDVVPRPDGSVDVVKPQARFYGKGDSMISLDGVDGHVFYTQAGARTDSKALATSTPTNGELHDVKLCFFEHKTDAEPVITVTVPAVKFDSNSNRISTIDCVVNGQGYAAEQVPVTMRGRDFDFDGQGLNLAWNDREGMLDQLEILRGNRLLVHDVSKFVGEAVVTRVPAPNRHTSSSALESLIGIVAVETPAPTDRGNDLYHATFDKDVHVIKDGKEIASGDVMRCVIPLEQSSKKPEPKAPAKRARPRSEAAGHRTQTSPATAPTTQPQPLEIHWTGKLIVRPVRLVPDAPHTQMVELVGSPARIDENGAVAVGRVIHVEPDAGKVRVEPGGTVRAIELTDLNGAQLRSRSPLTIDQNAGLATIEGGGALNIPASEKQKSPLAMSWARKLTLTLGSGPGAALEKINVDGDAKVDSDRLSLNCATLELGFDAPPEDAPEPATGSRFAMPSPDLSLLRRVHARGDAVCKVGADATQRTLSAQDIQLGFVGAEHDALLNSILCDGEVRLLDARGMNLAAGSMSVQTKPISLANDQDADADFFTLVTGFSAEKAVHITRPDGSSVDGQEVELAGIAEAQRLKVRGAPALLSSPKGSLQGSEIELDPATGDIRVPGEGSFVGANPKRSGTDVGVNWAESMNLDGKTGVCQFVGAVGINGHDDKGSQLYAQARHGTMQFQSKPASATKPAATGLGGLEFESIRSLTLDTDVTLNVTTTDGRSSSLDSSRLEIDLAAGTMHVPAPGRMLMIDHRAKPADDKGKFGPGELAMLWRERLDWDMRGGLLVLNGGVRVGFQREGANEPVRIICNQITGTLTPIDTTTGFDQMTPRIDLKTLRAVGEVAVRSKETSFDAAELLYDLQTQLAHAHGTDAQPVEVFDSQGTSRIGFSTITWNLETGLIEDFRDITGAIRR